VTAAELVSGSSRTTSAFESRTCFDNNLELVL
jgi:hypothetical protein